MVCMLMHISQCHDRSPLIQLNAQIKQLKFKDDIFQPTFTIPVSNFGIMGQFNAGYYDCQFKFNNHLLAYCQNHTTQSY